MRWDTSEYRRVLLDVGLIVALGDACKCPLVGTHKTARVKLGILKLVAKLVERHRGREKVMLFRRGRLLLALGALCSLACFPGNVPAALADSRYLITPSGNILCVAVKDAGAYGNFVACEIGKRSNKTPLQPRPASCDSDKDWGSGFIVPEFGKAELNCYHGGTLPPPGTTKMSYGDVFSFRGISCKVTKSNLTCRNAEGHGFTISRSKQKLF